MSDTRRTSLEDIRANVERGTIQAPTEGVEGVDMPEGFWDDAELVYRRPKTPVSLRVDEDILEFFKRGGRGHLTRMHAVLRAYVDTKTKKTG